MKDYYILDNDLRPVPASLEEWSRWRREDENFCKKTRIGAVTVSTVFLGIDHSFSQGGEPVLWETMIFDEPAPGCLHPSTEDYQERYTSHAEAIAGHTRAVDMVLARRPKS